MIGLIYKYTSPSGKVYIGKTLNEKSRKYQHKNNKSGNSSFSKAIIKYNFSNFTYEVLIKFQHTWDKDKLKRVLFKLEKRYIKLYKSNDKNYGYNT